MVNLKLFIDNNDATGLRDYLANRTFMDVAEEANQHGVPLTAVYRLLSSQGERAEGAAKAKEELQEYRNKQTGAE